MNTTKSMHQLWIQDALAKLMEIPPSELPVGVNLMILGVDSLVAVRLAGLISERFGTNVDPMVLFDHPTIEALAAYLDSPEVQASLSTEAQ